MSDKSLACICYAIESAFRRTQSNGTDLGEKEGKAQRIRAGKKKEGEISLIPYWKFFTAKGGRDRYKLQKKDNKKDLAIPVKTRETERESTGH